MVVLIVRPADLEGVPLGPTSRTARVTVEACYDRTIELNDGTVYYAGVWTEFHYHAAAAGPNSGGSAGGYWSGDLIASDDPRIVTGAGACVTVRATITPLKGGGGRGHRGGQYQPSKTIQVVMADNALVNLGQKASVVPVPASAPMIDWAALQNGSAAAVAKGNEAIATANDAADTAEEAKTLAAAANAGTDAGVAALISNPTAGPNTQAALRAVLKQRTVLVDDFRQPGDADDGPSFRRAAAAADHVVLKERTYLVSPVTSAAGSRKVVPMSHKVVWQGPGRDVCRVKVAPGSGDYHYVFGGDTGGTDFAASLQADLGGSSWSGFTIDGNATDNPISSYDNQLRASTNNGIYRGRVGIGVFRGVGATVEDMGFDDFQSIWCVQIIGANTGKGAVRRSRFTRIGHGTLNWDHTSVYLDCSGGGEVSFNEFEARAHAGRQPFELHGSDMKSFGNTARGYVYGMDATGSVHHGPSSGIASGNQFLGVASGLDIWTGTNYGVSGQFGMDGFIFDSNLVTADHARWGGEWYMGLVTLNNGASLPIRGLTISNNTYRLLSMGTPANIDQYSQVVSLTRSAAATPVTGSDNHDRDISILNNRVFGSVAGFTKYVHPGGGITGFTQRGNIVRDIGKGGSAAYDPTANSVLLMQTGTVRNSRHEGNSYSDTAVPRGLQRGSYYVASTLDNVFDDGSRITTADNNPITLASTTATTGAISLRGTVPRFDPAAHPAATGVQKFLPGSLVTDERTGKTWRQVGANGVNWVEQP